MPKIELPVAYLVAFHIYNVLSTYFLVLELTCTCKWQLRMWQLWCLSIFNKQIRMGCGNIAQK